MAFDPNAYGAAVGEILALDGGGFRTMPLANGVCSSDAARRLLRAASPGKLLAGSRAPEAAMAGLFLYFSCQDEAHELAQGIRTPDGSFWHGILHRQEPDPGNAAYWFRRVGAHPVFPALHEAAAGFAPECGLRLGGGWDPFAFIDVCERVRRHPGSAEERAAQAIQLVEWQLLFHHCART